MPSVAAAVERRAKRLRPSGPGGGLWHGDLAAEGLERQCEASPQPWREALLPVGVLLGSATFCTPPGECEGEARAGPIAARLVSGTLTIHGEFEAALVVLTGAGSAFVTSTGYAANTSVLTTLADAAPSSLTSTCAGDRLDVAMMGA